MTRFTPTQLRQMAELIAYPGCAEDDIRNVQSRMLRQASDDCGLLADCRQAFIQYGIDVDDYPTKKHRSLMNRLDAVRAQESSK